ncbi:large subunit GTPase 1 homolog [Cylas formicarius]|uniref:large subunit GTPase 1 homolog n=1 Tax=Cylas formicarius TaxID=197179 RepID=UPI00295888F3|nr:large subunit GTPase 1 homolog [Cylas formicarius]
MGKKNKRSNKSALGYSLIKDRFGKSNLKKFNSDSLVHTTELQDGYDWGKLNLQSVTEESSFQEFLSTAELAGTEFQAEKLNITFVNPRSNVGLLTKDEYKTILAKQKLFYDIIRIPRRPPWNMDTSAEELDKMEKQSFLEWRRSLAMLQENESILLTPYEKNLEFWRQLWRVIERSDILVQIVDARNPLLFRCEDIERYVKEVSEDKINVVLLNKADFLTEPQRQCWAYYFASINVQVAFFSATVSEEKLNLKESKVTKSETVKDSSNPSNVADIREVKSNIETLEKSVQESADTLNNIMDQIESIFGNTKLHDQSNLIQNSSKLLSREELVEFFKQIHSGPKVTKKVTTIGLVGYPNVGKSSTINALLTCKKVSVSSTPGKTKHFQTVYLEKDVILCDCPGLVMPSLVFTKAEMILNGILPVDQMRDHISPMNLVTALIPRHVIEEKYGILLPQPIEGEDPNRNPTAEELLNAYAFNRGFMTANGQPDNARAARYILKDFLNGKLLYCHAPPTIDQKKYHFWWERSKAQVESRILPPRVTRAIQPYKTSTSDFDKGFFKNHPQTAHIKGDKADFVSGNVDQAPVEKPWKKINKHHNKKKKEKLRRVYAHLDQH